MVNGSVMAGIVARKTGMSSFLADLILQLPALSNSGNQQ
jgi:hypothetical protein